MQTYTPRVREKSKALRQGTQCLKPLTQSSPSTPVSGHTADSVSHSG